MGKKAMRPDILHEAKDLRYSPDSILDLHSAVDKRVILTNFWELYYTSSNPFHTINTYIYHKPNPPTPLTTVYCAGAVLI